MRKGFADVTRADNGENIGSIGKIQINKSPSMQDRTDEAARKSPLEWADAGTLC